uniref:Alpha-mannosidase n=1 Tax=Glossina brevipalpis TaxID=37001 RepID=A0A1A9WU12_9MUSC
MMKLMLMLLVCVTLTLTQSSYAIKRTFTKCRYEVCPESKKNLINVHLVPHSHNGLGQLKNINEWFYDSKDDVTGAGVHTILDNVIVELFKDPNRRFVYAELVYFHKWFQRQTTEMQEGVVKLINEGRLEFVGGTWSSTNEATVHYQSIIDHFSLGLEFLSRFFGNCSRPRIAWQIDSFGHSREIASILAQMGYDGTFLSHIDYQNKEFRMKTYSSEMVWKTSANPEEGSDIFASVLYQSHLASDGFCFDVMCDKRDNIIDDESDLNNIEEKVYQFIQIINNMKKYYGARDLLLPIGGDFSYKDARNNFNMMDKLINYVNADLLHDSDVHVFYSTPSCYLQALHRSQLTWTETTQDFFPYADQALSYWTGYFTSRPTLKYFIRLGNHFLQVVKQLAAISKLHNIREALWNLQLLKQGMGIMQHEDVISGTSKQIVTDYFRSLLARTLVSAQNTAIMALQKLTNLKDAEFASCLLLNISVCEMTQNAALNYKDWLVTVYNPLTRPGTQYVRIPVASGSYTVRDSKGRIIESQLIPLPNELIELEHLRPNSTQYELVFKVKAEKLTHYYVKSYASHTHFHQINTLSITENPAMSQSTNAVSQTMNFESKIRELNNESGESIVENSLVKLFFDDNGFLAKVEMNNISHNVAQTFQYYESRGCESQTCQSSGSYIFSTDNSEAKNVGAEKLKLDIFEGPLIKEVHQHVNDWISQVIRIYEGVSRVEFEWLVGPIPIDDGIGKEVITKFKSQIANQGVFYTDTNGRGMIKRKRNGREFFESDDTGDVPSNYYPINGRLVLEGEGIRMALLNDRSQGGSNTEEGALELMLHRRLLYNDNRGVNEPLNEVENDQGVVARGKIYMILNSASTEAGNEERLAQQEIQLPPWLFFSQPPENIQSTISVNFSSLPEGIEVLSLEPFASDETLLRLEHMFEKTEMPEGPSITFNLKPFLLSLKAQEIFETTLDGNMLLKDMKRMKFQTSNNSPMENLEFYTAENDPLEENLTASDEKFEITLHPQQIRTFILTHNGSDHH